MICVPRRSESPFFAIRPRSSRVSGPSANNQINTNPVPRNQGAANGKIPDFKRGWGGRVGSSGWGSENFSLTFVLGTLEAGKHDVNNVNNVKCLITVSIGEELRELSPREET